MLKINKTPAKCFLFCLLAIICYSSCDARKKHHPPLRKADSSVDCNDGDTPTIYDEGLCGDFRDLKSLIPLSSLIRITKKHYQHDAKFRHAMSFIPTVDFASITEQIEVSLPFEDVLMEFENAGVNVTDIESIRGILNCLLMPMPDTDADADGGDGTGQTIVDSIAQRSLLSYEVELVNAIPRKEFRDLIANKLANKPQFAKFYNIMRTPGFRRQVMRGLSSEELCEPLALLRQNFIDIRKLMILAFKVLSYGPRN